jgi:hypothetical protein
MTTVNIPDYVFDIWRQGGKSEQEVERIASCLNMDAAQYALNYDGSNGGKIYIPLPDSPDKWKHKHKKRPAAQEAARLYENHTTKEIAQMYDVSITTVRARLMEAGARIERPSTKIDRATIDDIIKMKKSGLSWPEITEKTGYSYTIICNRFKDYGLELPKYFKPIGCEKCKTKPLCRGMCGACYKRWRARGKPKLGLDL